MNCYICSTEDRETTAVAVCPGCSAGLCPTHVEATARYRVGGTTLACEHGTWTPAG